MKILLGDQLRTEIPRFSDTLITYDGFAQYPLLNEDHRRALLQAEIRRHLFSERSVVAAGLSPDGVIQALIVAERFPWGEEHFGFGMAHVQHLLVDPQIGDDQTQRRARRELIEVILDWARSVDVVHLAGRFPIEDYRSVQEVEALGGRLVDTITTYTYNKHVVRKVPPIRRFFTITPFEELHRQAILGLCADSFPETRFSRDPAFDPGDITAFYQDWGKRLCDGSMSQRLLVATTSKGEVVGFLGYRLLDDLLESGGIKVLGGGLGAISPKAPGAYLALLHESLVLDAPTHDLAELESQIQNTGVIRLWHKLKCQQVRVTHTLHLKLD